MKLPRRDFLKTAFTVATASTLGLAKTAAAEVAAVGDGREFYELRAYRLKAGASAAALDHYLERALIPALNARGIGAVGVLVDTDPKEGAARWVLIPHPSLDSVGAIAMLNADPTVAAAAGDYFGAATKEQPAIDRIDSWLLLAFAGLPRLAVPALKREGKARIFELRTYESFSEPKALNKVAMFNAGEIALMQELGMSPVFYGQALVGRDLPQLTYMLCSPDRETAAKNWKVFSQHPVWVKMKSDPQWADNVSKIRNWFLAPTAYSQI